MNRIVPAMLVVGAIAANRVIPNEVVKEKLTKAFYGFGVAVTLGMSKNPTVGPMWNKTIEPVFVDFIDNVTYGIQNGFIKGLRSDNVPPVLDAMPIIVDDSDSDSDDHAAANLRVTPEPESDAKPDPPEQEESKPRKSPWWRAR